MSEENKIRDAADAVKGVVEAVPVYQDVLQPAAKEIGTALQTVTKAIHVALAPISALVWGYEKIKEYLDETLTEKLKKIPPERIVAPSPSVAVPTIEALRFTAHEPLLRELYANLLATAMDADTAIQAHPAFVELIRQLTPDEARIIYYLASDFHKPFYIAWGSAIICTELEGYEKGTVVSHTITITPSETLAVAAKCNRPDLADSCLDNIMRLGLLNLLEVEAYEHILYNVSSQRDLRDACELFLKKKDIAGRIDRVVFSGIIKVPKLTSFGRQFCTACFGQ